MRKSRTVWLLAAVVGMLAVAGCTGSGGTASADPADLEGTWVLESFGGTTELMPADPAVTTELTLQDGEATGSGGVNQFNGTYEATDDGSISFGPIASTRMAGSEEAMAQESEFFAALESAETFEFNDGKLVLGDQGNDTLAVFAAK